MIMTIKLYHKYCNSTEYSLYKFVLICNHRNDMDCLSCCRVSSNAHCQREHKRTQFSLCFTFVLDSSG